MEKLKIYLIKASAGSDYSKYKALTGGPPQNIFSAAAATPPEVDIEMTDETIGMKTNFKSPAELIVVFMSTPDAFRAYKIADTFRSKGKTVVLGGLHTTVLPDEAADHADSILLGEAEGIWEQLLEDHQQGSLKPIYQHSSFIDLELLKPYPIDIIKPSKYYNTWSVVVSRGCPMACNFCLVPRFSGKIRYRPIPKIVEEIRMLKEAGVEWVELHSDNLTANRKYAMELFEALAPLNMKLFGETTILIAKDEALLKAARKAGVKALLFGIETPSAEALKNQAKGFIKPEQVKDYIKVIKQHGIETWGDFLFGFDEHDNSIFEETEEFIKDIEIDRAIPHLMIPFPGSTSFEKLDQEGRILTKDWSKYDGSHAVFKPAKMTGEELEYGVYRVYKNVEKWQKKRKKNLSNITSSYDTENSQQSLQQQYGFKWKASLAVVCIVASLILDLRWFWGVFCFLWVLPDLKRGSTHLFESVDRSNNPFLYWVIIALWLFMSGYLLTNTF